MNVPITQTTECEPRSLEETLGSQYALQVALQTMKERCHQLQARLLTVEEENIRLRVKRDVQSDNTTDTSLVAISELQDVISKLTRQKSQLMHRECMVTQENQKLWNRLSQLTKANKSLGGHLTNISKSISDHEISSWHLNETARNLKPGFTESTMDEVHLKPGNSLIQENAELGNQYNQMVESIKNSVEFPIQNLGFSHMDQECVSTAKEINKHREKLQEIKTMLADQQHNLKLALKNHKQFVMGLSKCSKCAEEPLLGSNSNAAPSVGGVETLDSSAGKSPEISPVTSTEPLREEKPDDHICPMCGKFYPKLRPFDDFLSHVSSHFEDQDTVLSGFEVVS